MGYDIVIYPVCTVFTAAKAMKDMLYRLKTDHTTRDCLSMMTSFKEYTDIVGMPRLMELEQKYKVEEFKNRLRKD